MRSPCPLDVLPAQQRCCCPGQVDLTQSKHSIPAWLRQQLSHRLFCCHFNVQESYEADQQCMNSFSSVSWIHKVLQQVLIGISFGSRKVDGSLRRWQEFGPDWGMPLILETFLLMPSFANLCHSAGVRNILSMLLVHHSGLAHLNRSCPQHAVAKLVQGSFCCAPLGCRSINLTLKMTFDHYKTLHKYSRMPCAYNSVLTFLLSR